MEDTAGSEQNHTNNRILYEGACTAGKYGERSNYYAGRAGW